MQFGDLWVPDGGGKKFPLVVFFHGGWWLGEYDLGYAGFLCAALKRADVAVWSVEYRRVGDEGGGWPGTFQDAAAGCDFAAQLATTYPLDMERMVLAGHSAGGHLAFWCAGRQHVPESSPIYSVPKVHARGAVSLAGAVDLELVCELAGHFTFAHDRARVAGLMGGVPPAFPERYAAGDPGNLLPLNIPQWLVQGTDDHQIPPKLPERWAQKARRIGDTVTVAKVEGANHFAVVDPESKAWPTVMSAFRAAIG